MRYSLFGSEYKTDAEFLANIENIPQGTDDLKIEFYDLGIRPTEVILQALKKLPSSVTSLDLKCNKLYLKPADDLSQILAAIPHNISTVKLHGNFTRNESIRTLADGLKKLQMCYFDIFLLRPDLGKDVEKGLEIIQTALPHVRSITVPDSLGNNVKYSHGAISPSFFLGLCTSSTVQNTSLALAALGLSMITLNVVGYDVPIEIGATLSLGGAACFAGSFFATSNKSSKTSIPAVALEHSRP